MTVPLSAIASVYACSSSLGVLKVNQLAVTHIIGFHVAFIRPDKLGQLLRFILVLAA